MYFKSDCIIWLEVAVQGVDENEKGSVFVN